MGRNHVRILSEMESATLVGLCDLRNAVAEELAATYRSKVYYEVEALLDQVDAVVIAVPTIDHLRLVRQALHAGCHVLVEKPMAANLEEADSMLEAAGSLVLAVGHVEFFNPAVQRLLELARGPRFVEVERISAFSPRSLDVDVVLDLMIHDLQVVQALDPSEIVEMRAIGIDVLTSQVDIANVRLELASGCVVNLTASRISDHQVRNLRVFDRDAYYSLDYQDQSIKGFRLGGEESLSDDGGAQSSSTGHREILLMNPEVQKAEPLRLELESFVAVCSGDGAGAQTRLVDGKAGRRALATALGVVSALQAASRE